MPAVKPGEKQSDYVDRCIPYVMKHEGANQKAAEGKCYGLWAEHHQKAKASVESTSSPTEHAMSDAIPVSAHAATKLNKITIETDGTAAGTTILLNGKRIENLVCFDFTIYGPRKDGVNSGQGMVCVNFSTEEPDVKPGELTAWTSYRLRPPVAAVASTGVQQAVASEASNLEKLGVPIASHIPSAVRRALYAQIP